MRTLVALFVALIPALACTGSATQATVPCPPPAATSDLTAFEHGLVDATLTDIRAGVRPWDDHAIGVCASADGDPRGCGTFLGADAGELPPGDYVVRAELRVPNAGDKGAWKVRYATECTLTKVDASGEKSTTSTASKDYDVQYAGEDHGARLAPLTKVRSPGTRGTEKCTWKLTSLSGDHPGEWHGSWTVPLGQ